MAAFSLALTSTRPGPGSPLIRINFPSIYKYTRHDYVRFSVRISSDIHSKKNRCWMRGISHCVVCVHTAYHLKTTTFKWLKYCWYGVKHQINQSINHYNKRTVQCRDRVWQHLKQILNSMLGDIFNNCNQFLTLFPFTSFLCFRSRPWNHLSMINELLKKFFCCKLSLKCYKSDLLM